MTSTRTTPPIRGRQPSIRLLRSFTVVCLSPRRTSACALRGMKARCTRTTLPGLRRESRQILADGRRDHVDAQGRPAVASEGKPSRALLCLEPCGRGGRSDGASADRSSAAQASSLRRPPTRGPAAGPGRDSTSMRDLYAAEGRECHGASVQESAFTRYSCPLPVEAWVSAALTVF